jgi:hypothetical protein
MLIAVNIPQTNSIAIPVFITIPSLSQRLSDGRAIHLRLFFPCACCNHSRVIRAFHRPYHRLKTPSSAAVAQVRGSKSSKTFGSTLRRGWPVQDIRSKFPHMSLHGTKRKCRNAPGISGAGGRPAVPSAGRPQPPLTQTGPGRLLMANPEFLAGTSSVCSPGAASHFGRENVTELSFDDRRRPAHSGCVRR